MTKQERDKEIEDNLRFVGYIIKKKFQHNNNDYDDLYQAGSMGLIKAVDTFDLSKGNKGTYYYSCIYFGICMYLRENQSVRFNHAHTDIYVKVKKICRDLNDDVEIEKACNILNIDVERVKKAISIYNRCTQLTYLDKVYDNDDNKDTSLIDMIQNNVCEYETVENSMLFKLIMEKLPERQREVLRLLYIEDLKQHEVGELLHISQTQISRDLKAALKNARLLIETGEIEEPKNIRKLTYDGETRSVADWCRKLGLNRNTVNKRLSSGYPVERVLGFC